MQILMMLPLCVLATIVNTDGGGLAEGGIFEENELEGDVLVNLAKGATASSSSTGWNGEARKLIDGKSNGGMYRNARDGVCAHTRNNGPKIKGQDWFKIDFGSSKDIGSFMFVGRKDCCHHQSNGLTVKVGDKGDWSDATCKYNVNAAGGAIKMIECDKKLKGQYLTVYRRHHMVLCEIEAYADFPIPPEQDCSTYKCSGDRPEPVAGIKCSGKTGVSCSAKTCCAAAFVTSQPDVNVALRKPATSSSEGWGGRASKLVDGKHDNGRYSHRGHCMHTNNHGDNWVRVDLQHTREVGTVYLHGRDHHHWQGNDLTIRVGHTGTLRDPICKSRVNVGGTSATLQCSTKMKGQYITISTIHRQMVLCEMEAYSKYIPETDCAIFDCSPFPKTPLNKNGTMCAGNTGLNCEQAVCCDIRTWSSQPSNNATCSPGVCSKGKWLAYYGGQTESQCKATCDGLRKLEEVKDGAIEKVYTFRQNGRFHDVSTRTPKFTRSIQKSIDYKFNRDQKFLKERVRDHFYVQWSGFIEIKAAGKYKFFTVSDDGSLLNINGKRVVYNPGWHGMRWKEGTVDLSAGKHSFVAEMFEGGGGEGMQLHYQGPDTQNKRILVPGNTFSASTAGGTAFKLPDGGPDMCTAYSFNQGDCVIYSECSAVDQTTENVCGDNSFNWIEGTQGFSTCQYPPL
jgi:hypothetical protein